MWVSKCRQRLWAPSAEATATQEWDDGWEESIAARCRQREEDGAAVETAASDGAPFEDRAGTAATEDCRGAVGTAEAECGLDGNPADGFDNDDDDGAGMRDILHGDQCGSDDASDATAAEFASSHHELIVAPRGPFRQMAALAATAAHETEAWTGSRPSTGSQRDFEASGVLVAERMTPRHSAITAQEASLATRRSTVRQLGTWVAGQVAGSRLSRLSQLVEEAHSELDPPT